jgi:hypothetical protein
MSDSHDCAELEEDLAYTKEVGKLMSEALRAFVDAAQCHCAGPRCRHVLGVDALAVYDKHCAPRAVECAEGDLLGKALVLLGDTLLWMNESLECPGCGITDGDHDDGCRALMIVAVLAKVPR